MTNKQKESCHAILEHFGIELQIIKSQEEFGELMVELSKILLLTIQSTEHDVKLYSDYVKLAEEIADTEIMLEQIKHGLGLYEVVENQIDFKLKELKAGSVGE